MKQLKNLRIQESQERNKQFFDEEMEKLESWAQDEIDSQKDKLLDRIESLLRQKTALEELFCIGWKLV